jgi:polyphosphate kinase 2 (PPK2 family)
MLDRLDMNKRLDVADYERLLVENQLKLRALAYQLYLQKRNLIIVFEGWDAAGKGGTIKRITERLDPRGYEVFPIAAPNGEDHTHHYLWRFWRRLRPPDEKQVQIFDRSWYGRVMVERIEGFCSEEAWKRAYREINEFERQLIDGGALIAKFWMHITAEEQLRRFNERQSDPYKAWKLTDEDWRNRQKWDQYMLAVQDMLLKTSTLKAPWTVVEDNDKFYGRIKTLQTLVKLLEHGLPDSSQPAVNGKPVKKKKKQATKNAVAGVGTHPEGHAKIERYSPDPRRRSKPVRG